MQRFLPRMVHTGIPERIGLLMNVRYFFGLVVLMAPTIAWSGGDTAVEAAKQDLATRLHVPVEQVSVIFQKERDWPDRSAGCPRKGMLYAQVVTNGSELELAVAGKRYSYHARAGEPYFYCVISAKKSGGAASGAPRHDI